MSLVQNNSVKVMHRIFADGETYTVFQEALYIYNMDRNFWVNLAH